MTVDDLLLTRTETGDLDTLFEFQLDEEANYLAAFTSGDSSDRSAYIEKYSRFLTDPSIHMRTIKLDGRIVGSIAKYVRDGHAEITYWIDREVWGNGVATTALTEFLNIERTRPLFARVAFDNLGSRRVLEKCGFVKVGVDKGFANARQAEIEEYTYELSD